MRAYVHTQSLMDFGRVWQNLAELSRSQSSQQNSAEFIQTFILLERSFWQNLAELAELGRIYLSSVSPRHSYCNWVSPVTYIYYLGGI